MDGVNYTAYHDYAYPANRQPVSTNTDTNGDGKTHLTMRDSATGTVEILQMDGVNYTGYQDIAYPVDWQPVVGT